MKKLAANVLSMLIGFGVFVLVIKLAGLENVLRAIKSFSPLYFLLFLLVTSILFLAATIRWKIVLSGEGVIVPVWTLLKYKFVVFSINYFTPTGRLGGEPLKIMLLKKQRIKSSKSFASIVVDNFVGMGFDTVVGGVVLIALVLTSARLPNQTRELFLMTGLASLGVVTAAYFILVKKKSVFSYILDVIGGLTQSRKQKLFTILYEKVAKAEFYMREILVKRPKSLLLALFFAALSWPLTILQYKLALLMIGIDSSLLQILLSVVVLSFTSLIPIPAALGVQEAGQFSAFKLFSANPHAGIALSLILRFKDMILLLISFLFLSKEGIDIFSTVNKKIFAGIRNNKKD